MTFSIEKVENVLNPPATPTARNKNEGVPGAKFLKAPKMTIAKTKLAKTLLTKVPASGCVGQDFAHQVTPYRNKLPTPPPIKTANQFIIVEIVKNKCKEISIVTNISFKSGNFGVSCVE